MTASPFRIRVLILCTLLAGTASRAAEVVPIATIRVADGINMFVGRGGNVAVVHGADGVFVVDDQYAEQYEAIRTALRAITDAPVKFLLNTHWHSDHTGGNAAMGESGAVIFAHANVRRRMSKDQVIEFFNAPRPASPEAALPVVTFTRDVTFHFNGETIRAFHVAPAHTDGDTVVHFRTANVIHTGDVFFNERYPFIDTGSSGSIDGMIAAADVILALADDDTKIIPGHGPLSDKRGLAAYRDMLREVRRAVAQLIVSGATEEQAVLARPTAAFDPVWGDGFLDPPAFVRMVYDNIRRQTLR